MALKALENPWKAKPEGVVAAIQALRQALAHPQTRAGEMEWHWGYERGWDAATKKKREWVGLTEEEFSELLYFDGRLDHVEVPLIADLIRTIQAKLKEKNRG